MNIIQLFGCDITYWQCEFQTLEDVELIVQMEEVVLLGVFGGGRLARIQVHAVVSTRRVVTVVISHSGILAVFESSNLSFRLSFPEMLPEMFGSSNALRCRSCGLYH